MERTGLYKFSSKAAASRGKRLKECLVLGKEKRASILYSKRVKYELELSEERDEDDSFREFSDAVNSLRTSEGQAKALRFLQKSFAEEAYAAEFLKNKEAFDVLVGISTRCTSTLQLEAVWCIVNLTASAPSKQCVSIARAVAPYLITYLSSSDVTMQEASCWALGNIAGDGPACRALLVAQGAVPPLVGLLKSHSEACQGYAAFALTGFAQKPVDQRSVLVSSGIVPAITDVLGNPDFYNGKSNDVLTEISWLLSFLSASCELEEALMSGNLLERTLALTAKLAEDFRGLGESNGLLVYVPLMRFLGNMLCGSDEITRRLCSDGSLLRCMRKCISSADSWQIKEALWLLSNLSGSQYGCSFLRAANIIDDVIRCLGSTSLTTSSIQTEAAIVLCNVASSGIDMLRNTSTCALDIVPVAMKVLASAVPAGACSDSDGNSTKVVVLALLSELLQHHDCRGKFLETGGLQLVESLSYHASESIRKAACDFLQKYAFSEDAVQ